jgi:hypothetical protein
MVHEHAHGHDVSLADLVADGLLDAELAGLAWALAAGGIGVLVASPAEPASHAAGRAAAALVAALVDAASLTTRVVPLAPGSAPGPVASAVADAGDGVLVLRAPDLGGAGESALRRAAARAAIRAVSDRRRVALVATVRGADLEGVLERLRGLTVAAPEDEILRLGAVLVVADVPAGPAATPGGARVVAAHYLRPPAVGPLGRVERRAPAVLATFDADAGAWDHFAWGIEPELAERMGIAPAALGDALAVRRETIAALVAHGLRGIAPFRAAANLAIPAPRA